MLLVALAAVAVSWKVLSRSSPPSVNFARAARRPLASSIPTNGKTEPFEWQPVRAEIAGMVDAVPVQEGQSVASGRRTGGYRRPVARSRYRRWRGESGRVARGPGGASGRWYARCVTEIDNSLARARLDLEREQREADSLQRLVDQQAATRRKPPPPATRYISRSWKSRG